MSKIYTLIQDKPYSDDKLTKTSMAMANNLFAITEKMADAIKQINVNTGVINSVVKTLPTCCSK